MDNITTIKNSTVVVEAEQKQLLPRRTIVGVILGLMGIDILISWFYLLHQSLRLDESQSLYQASHSFAGVFKVVATDVHVPLYHIILHFWILGFGSSVATVRILSLVFFLLTIPMSYLMAREILSQKLSLFAVALLSLSPFMNWYGSEARMYTLMTLFAVTSQYFFLRIMKGKPGHNWLGYVLTVVVGVYTHYFFIFALLTQAIFYLAQRKHFPVGSFKRFVGTALLAGLSLSPWLIFVYKLGLASGERPMLSRPSTVDLFNTFSQFIFGFQPDGINTILVSFWPLSVLLVFFAIGHNRRVPRGILFMLTAAFLPVIGAYVLSLTVTPVFVSRYLILSLPSLYIFIAWLFSNYTRRVMQAAAILLILAVTVTGFHQDTSASTPVKEDYKAVAATIARDATPSDVVVLSTPFSIYPFEYYYHGSASIKTLPDWDRGPIPAFDETKLPAQVTALAQDHSYAYLLLSYDQGYESKIYSYFNSHFEQVSKKVYSKDLTLYVYHINYRLPPHL
jgi:mannosyltransferase